MQEKSDFPAYLQGIPPRKSFFSGAQSLVLAWVTIPIVTGFGHWSFVIGHSRVTNDE
jgi:hypothetical protein